MTHFYPQPRKIIRSGPATILLFDDGSKSVVRLRDGDTDDPYIAVCCAIAKRFVGSGIGLKRMVDEIEYFGEPPKATSHRQHIHVDRESDIINFMLDELFDRTFSRSVK